MGIVLFKDNGQFVISQESPEGFAILDRFESIDALKSHLNTTGTRITWFSESLSDFEVFFHLKKFQETPIY